MTSIFEGKLEPETKDMQTSDAALYSAAISLKRIADVLTGIGDTAILTNTIQHYAWEAGRSFQQGVRTDR